MLCVLFYNLVFLNSALYVQNVSTVTCLIFFHSCIGSYSMIIIFYGSPAVEDNFQCFAITENYPINNDVTLDICVKFFRFCT